MAEVCTEVTLENNNNNGKNFLKKKKRKRLLPGAGFAAIVAIPCFLQWLFMIVIGVVDTVTLPFQEYNGRDFVMLPFNDLFRNFIDYFSDLKNDPDILRYILNGYMFSILNLVLTEFSLFFAFAAARKLPGFSLFSWVLILPGIFGGLINNLLFKYFCEKALPRIMLDNFGVEIPLLFTSEKTALFTSLFMQLYFAFAGSLLFYTGQFSKVPAELWEYGKLEGLTFLQEFFYIGFPAIFSVWSLAHLGILTSGLTTTGPGYSLYGTNGYKYGVVTFAYHILCTILGGRKGSGGAPMYAYPYTAAVNLVNGMLQFAGAVIMVKIFDRLNPEAEF